MESKNSWKVICTGNIKPGFTDEIVIDSIKKTFEFDNEKAHALIQGIPTIVKQGIDKQEALQYQSMLEGAGVETILEAPPIATTFSLDELSLVPLESEPEQERDNINTQQAAQHTHHTQYSPTQPYQPERADHVRKNIDKEETMISKLMANKKQIIALICLVMIIKFFFLGSANYQEIGNDPAALAQIQTLKRSRENPKQDANQLRSLLKSNHSQLDSILRELNDNVSYDIIWERIFIDAINKVSETDKVILQDLNNWVNDTGSAYAYLARGAFYVNAGADARGGKVLSKTSDAQISAMNKLYLAAHDDLMKAKSIDNSLLPIYALLIQINIDGTSSSRESILNEAIAVNPAGSQYRSIYMFYSRPKWGGSWEKMEQLASDSAAYISYNPWLNLLPGYIPAEKADIASRKDDFNTCISYYSEALQYGIQGDWLRQRAYCLYDNGDFERALSDINLFFEYFDYANDYDKKLKNYLTHKVK